MANKSNNNTLIQNADKIKATVKNINAELMETSDQLVEEALVTGEQWQKLFAKALKSSVHLFGQQQELALDTLELLKAQYTKGNKRFLKLISLDWRGPVELKTRVNGTRKKVVAKAEAQISKVAQKAVATKAKVRKTSKKASKKVVEASIAQNDLTMIEGIGPKIAEHLQKSGIQSFDQLAKSSIKELRAILDAAGPRYKKYNPSTWRQQAKLAAGEKWTALKELQSTLKGGLPQK
ncbi:MAG: helix-hairpin-helix domain-containing protein [Bacteroidota bacterium]